MTYTRFRNAETPIPTSITVHETDSLSTSDHQAATDTNEAATASLPTKSLLSAASNRSAVAPRPAGGYGRNAKVMTASPLRAARANAIARRARTSRKLERKEQQKYTASGSSSRTASAANQTPKKIPAERNNDIIPDTPATLNTTMESADVDNNERYDITEPYETNADGLTYEPNADTGDIEVFVEAGYYTQTNLTEEIGNIESETKKPDKGLELEAVSSDDECISEGGDVNYDDVIVAKPEIWQRIENFVDNMSLRMLPPTEQLRDLLAVIRVNTNTERTTMAATRAAMKRRLNACGVLKILASNPDNSVPLAWTEGVLPALISVLTDSPFHCVDKGMYNSFMMTRRRALEALVPLSVAVDNRMVMMHSPNLVTALVQIINEDEGVCRTYCTIIISHLSACLENRLLLRELPGLIDSIVNILRHNEEEPTYDSNSNAQLHITRTNGFAVLYQLSKEKENAFRMVKNKALIEVLIDVSKMRNTSSNSRALAVLLHLTRHKEAAEHLVFDNDGLVAALIGATSFTTPQSKLRAIHCLENLSTVQSCQKIIFETPGLIPRLGQIAEGTTSTGDRKRDSAIRQAAVKTVNNLADESGNLMLSTDAQECSP